MLALQKAEKMKKQAFADRYPYGIFSCIRTMGHIYKSRGNFDLSAQYYQEALDYMLKNMPDQDPSQLYSSLAEYYRNTQKDYATALDYCEKALKSAKTERNIAQAMIEKCLVLFRQGRIDEFNDCYKEAVQMADRCKLSASVSLLIAHISKNILDKQYEQAHAHADQLSEKGLQQHAYIYECAKDYPNAIKYLKKYHQQLDSTNNLLQLSDIAELNTQIGAERLKMENIQATSRYRITLFSIVTGFLLLSLLFLMLYLHRKRKVNLELCHKNEELSEARDQAEAANKAKSIFLQNMSNEIRTPLNSIVGFSQLITSPDANLSQEERQDFCHLIQHNSDLLLTLVGDILSAAELESNRYTMKIAPHSCNKLCREAITTVEHRKPEGVKLYYTSEVDDCYELSTDGQRVCQILINFLTNAEKHTTQGEIRLHCSLTEHPGYVTFSVTDTGTGIPPEYSETIFERFEKADNFGQAIIQGGVAMIGYLLFGAPNILMLGFLTCFATIIPMVGTALVWFPVAAYLAISGDWFNAIGLFGYGAIVVSQSDNLIRFILQKKMADTHPLITIFGVVIGLPIFGFMGVIFGPLLLSLFFLFVDMFKKEYLDLRNNLPSR